MKCTSSKAKQASAIALIRLNAHRAGRRCAPRYRAQVEAATTAMTDAWHCVMGGIDVNWQRIDTTCRELEFCWLNFEWLPMKLTTLERITETYKLEFES